jgi:hypothetical protein
MKIELIFTLVDGDLELESPAVKEAKEKELEKKKKYGLFNERGEWSEG